MSLTNKAAQLQVSKHRDECTIDDVMATALESS